MSLTSKPSIGQEPGQVNLGFGCAGLMRSASRRHRQRLLGEAFEQGIRHFDVARMYGLGEAERELGRFARFHRDQITIATKFGIDPSGPARWLAPVQAPARATIARLSSVRTMLKRREGALRSARDYSPETARMSLLTSLDALGTDYIDILFIHDPGAVDSVDIAQLAAALEDLRRDGYIGAWGVSGEVDPCMRLRNAAGVPTVLQIRDDIFNSELARIGSNSRTVTFGVLSRALNRVLLHLGSSKERRLRWSREIGEDCGRPDVIASLLLQDALERNAAGKVLFSTTRPDRIRAARATAEAVARGSGRAALQAFRERVSVELGEGSHPRG